MVVLPAGMDAANISVAKVLEYLDGPFRETADGLANGEYVLWLGSAISRERVDDLGTICLRVLKHLWEGRVVEGATGPFTNALNRALTLAGLNDADKSKIDFTRPPEIWATIDQIVRQLANKYSSLLGIPVEGKANDYLIWEVVDVPSTYAKNDLKPDCEHICVAILALEGLLGNVATANWDGLIEKAIVELADDTPHVLAVCVRRDDFTAGATRTRLLKFHGCAVRAKQDPDTYRDYLVGRASQIITWGNDDNYKLMRYELVALASKNPSLVVGLSVQDFNIKAIFSEGGGLKPHAYPSHPPAYVFAEQELGIDQEQLLQCVYGSKEYATHLAEINESARIPAFAKPLLTALVLSALAIKLAAYASRTGAPAFVDADRGRLVQGIIALRNRIAKSGDGDRLAFIKGLVTQASKLLSSFRGLPSPGAAKFVGLGVHPVSQIAGDPNLGTTGLPELASVAGLLGCIVDDSWTVEVQDGGALEIDNTVKKRKLFIVVSSDAVASLVATGRIDEDDANTVVSICTAVAVRQKRSPTSAPGRVLKPNTATDVAVRSILHRAKNAREAVQFFREEVGL